MKKKIYNFNNKQWLLVDSLPKGLIEISITEAVKKLQNSSNRIKTPIGIVGTNKPTDLQFALAQNLGKELAKHGLIILCGGRAGIMEAVCKGANEMGGLSIGLLPEVNLENANKYVAIPLATGFGLARGVMIATSSLCLVAIGGGNGTWAELANGLQFGKKIFSIDSEINLPKLKKCYSIHEILENIAMTIFNIKNEDCIYEIKNI